MEPTTLKYFQSITIDSCLQKMKNWETNCTNIRFKWLNCHMYYTFWNFRLCDFAIVFKAIVNESWFNDNSLPKIRRKLNEISY